jgi:hypothetical protein
MATNILNDLKREISRREAELQALKGAMALLQKTEGKNKPVITLSKVASAVSSAKSSKPAKKGKRGRPVGSGKKAAPIKQVKRKPGRPKATDNGGRVGNLSERIVKVITKSNRFMTNSEITNKLVALYPDKDRSYLGKYMSVILSNLKHRKELRGITVDKEGNRMRSALWGLPTWFDGNNGKSEYLK